MKELKPQIIIVEIKAKTNQVENIRNILLDHHAEFIGTDHQVDTYFKVANGRLKLREGNIENNLIFYKRGNQAGPKKSEVKLYRSTPDSTLKSLLENSIGVFTVVDKIRSIYFIDNVKFHIDEVKDLGSFMEIEAIDETGKLSEEFLLEQCNKYMKLFDIREEDLIECSYSDLMENGTQI